MVKKKEELAVTQGEKFTLSIDDVKAHWAPKATDQELYVFMETAKLYGLNPVKREIYFVKYGNNPGQTLIGYEYYLRRAEETGQLNGWKVAFAKDEFGEKAVVTIHRKDRDHPFVWEVYRQEVDKKQALWTIMPMFMTKKVAIAQAFRLAFPEQLGGAPFIQEEVVVNGEVVDVKPEPVKKPKEKPKPKPAKPVKEEAKIEDAPPPPHEDLLKQVVDLKKELHITDRNAWAKLIEPYGLPSARDFSSEQLTQFIGELEAMRPTPAPGD